MDPRCNYIGTMMGTTFLELRTGQRAMAVMVAAEPGVLLPLFVTEIDGHLHTDDAVSVPHSGLQSLVGSDVVDEILCHLLFIAYLSGPKTVLQLIDQSFVFQDQEIVQARRGILSFLHRLERCGRYLKIVPGQRRSDLARPPSNSGAFASADTDQASLTPIFRISLKGSNYHPRCDMRHPAHIR